MARLELMVFLRLISSRSRFLRSASLRLIGSTLAVKGSLLDPLKLVLFCVDLNIVTRFVSTLVASSQRAPRKRRVK